MFLAGSQTSTGIENFDGTRMSDQTELFLDLQDCFSLEMWDDENIPNMYEMDFISVFTSNMDNRDITANNEHGLNVVSPSSMLHSPTTSSVHSPTSTYSGCEDFTQQMNITNHHQQTAHAQRAQYYGNFSSEMTAAFQEIPVKQWTYLDVACWLKQNLRKLAELNHVNVVLDNFKNIDGLVLTSLTLNDFITLSCMYGSFLYEKLQECLRAENSASQLHQLLPVSPESSYKDVPSNVVSMMLSDRQLSVPNEIIRIKTETDEDNLNRNYLPACLGDEFSIDQKDSVEIVPVKKKPGRPRGSKRAKPPAPPKEHRLGRLWEFIRDLLLSEKYCPKYICWDNYEEGKFRFVESDKVAKLWGSIKGNSNMNYEKFSRAMRYYYKSEVLLPVEGRRLVYKFGPKATGWRTNNPNFQFN